MPTAADLPSSSLGRTPTTYADPEFILYDLWSPELQVCYNTEILYVRAVLNYKRIPYETVLLEHHEVEAYFSQRRIRFYPGKPTDSAYLSRMTCFSSLPVVQHVPSRRHIVGRSKIVQYLCTQYPSAPRLEGSSPSSTVTQPWNSALSLILRHFIFPREILFLSPQAALALRRYRDNQNETLLESKLWDDDYLWESIRQHLGDYNKALGKRALAGQPYLSTSGIHPSGADLDTAADLHQIFVFDRNAVAQIQRYPYIWNLYLSMEAFVRERREGEPGAKRVRASLKSDMNAMSLPRSTTPEGSPPSMMLKE